MSKYATFYNVISSQSLECQELLSNAPHADGARSDRVVRARRSDVVDTDGAAVGEVSSTGQARRARAMHVAMGRASGPC